MTHIDLNDLYQDILKDHSKTPHHYGKIESPDLFAEADNPLCGDRVSLMIQLDETKHRIQTICFESSACAICTASTSMMTDVMIEKDTKTALDLVGSFRSMMQGERMDLSLGEEIEALSGVRKFPMRIKCALLPWMILRDILQKQINLLGYKKI